MKHLRFLIMLLFAVCAAGALSSCSKADLPAPERLRINSDTLELTWALIPDADSYLVDVGGTERSATQNKYSLADLDAGTYSIRVRAISISDFDPSPWSQPIEFVREAESGVTYRLVKGKTAYEVAGTGSFRGSELVIADEYRGKPVVSIGTSAFAGNSRITSVVVGKNVTSIGDRAFYNCSILASVTLPEGLESMGSYAFQSCRNLESIRIPESVARLPDYAFSYCRGLRSVSLGTGLESIGSYTFSECSSLTSVSIPDSTTTIGSYAFSGCTALGEIRFGAETQTVGDYAFYRCGALETVTLGQNIVTLGNYAFSNCENLASVSFPESLETIGYCAFYNDPHIESVTLGSSVKSIGAGAFMYTALYEAAQTLVFADSWLIDIKTKDLDDYQIPSGTQGIADQCFLSCNIFTGIEIPATVKHIGQYAFYAAKILPISYSETD